MTSSVRLTLVCCLALWPSAVQAQHIQPSRFEPARAAAPSSWAQGPQGGPTISCAEVIKPALLTGAVVGTAVVALIVVGRAMDLVDQETDGMPRTGRGLATMGTVVGVIVTGLVWRTECRELRGSGA